MKLKAKIKSEIKQKVKSEKLHKVGSECRLNAKLALSETCTHGLVVPPVRVSEQNFVVVGSNFTPAIFL